MSIPRGPFSLLALLAPAALCVAMGASPRPAEGAMPASGPATRDSSEPASQRTQVLAPAPSAGETVNALIDDLLATGNRILELPLFMLLAALAVVGAALALLIARLCRKGSRPRLRRALLTVVAVFLVFAVAFIVDRKIVLLQNEITDLRSRMIVDRLSAGAVPRGEAASRPEATSKPDGRRNLLLFDAEGTQMALTAIFGQVTMLPSIYDEATDIVQVRIKNPLAQACLAVVDLQHPALEIRLGATVQKKRPTSEFARESDCTVAINGEAGLSPDPNSGLGQWKGNLIDRGKVILQEDRKTPRPFLSFDRKNRARYFSTAAGDRAVAPDSYNVIWGRTDALVDGLVVTADWRNRQPRTAMAVNKDGTRLYLVVVDGRQPDYSMGFTRAEAGKLLKAFGAYNGMLCDEGGSSCIWLKKFGGISSIPSDNHGQERPTYTHFGIRLRDRE